MNCKQGYLAMIVRSASDENIGRIVRVLRFYGEAGFKGGAIRPDCWLVEGRLKTFSGAPYCKFARELGADHCVPDEWLRPIRDPGDDARDESLSWLPVPSKEVA